jgi:hypothetical protein
MTRSNAPLALSVVNLTNPESVEDTVLRITQFDDREFGFNHNRTWASIPKALTGKFDPTAVAKSFTKEPVRVQRCITALCDLGVRRPVETRSFAEYPEAGLRSVAPIEWDPGVTVRVKACCWYVRDRQVVLPVLQPRKDPLNDEQLGVYLRLVRQAYCQGDWVDASVEIIDLSGDGDVVAVPFDETSISPADDGTIRRYVKTFVEAKRIADAKRAERPEKQVKLPMDELLDIKE